MDLALIHLLLTASPPYRVAHPLLTAIPPYRVAYSSRWPNNAGKVSPPCFVGHNTFAAALVDYTGGHLESCNVTAPPLSCYTAPKAVKACLDGVPAGRRAVHLNTGIFLGPGNTERWAEVDAGSPRGWTLWADEWAVTVKARFDAWFRELASIGGSVDLVILDFEAGPWWLSEYFRYGAADVGRVTGDSRWPAVRTLLNAAGAPFGVNFDDISDIGNWSTDPSDFRQWVWTDVMLSRRGAYLNHSLYEPARKAFPDVRGVDYDHAMRPAPGPHWAYSYGGVSKPPVCCGSHVGTHSSRPYYGWEPVGHPLIVWTAPAGPAARPTPALNASAPTTPFNMLLHYVRQLRGQALSGVPQMPWLAPKNSSWYTTGSHRSVLSLGGAYEELVLHMGLSAVREWLWWRPGSETADLMEGADRLSDLLKELDSILGERVAPLCLGGPVTFEDLYLLSGSVAAAGNQTAWRFSPRDIGSTIVLSAQPATFRVPGHEQPLVPVPGARIVQTVAATRADAGFWLVANGSSAPLTGRC